LLSKVLKIELILVLNIIFCLKTKKIQKERLIQSNM